MSQWPFWSFSVTVTLTLDQGHKTKGFEVGQSMNYHYTKLGDCNFNSLWENGSGVTYESPYKTVYIFSPTGHIFSLSFRIKCILKSTLKSFWEHNITSIKNTKEDSHIQLGSGKPVKSMQVICLWICLNTK